MKDTFKGDRHHLIFDASGYTMRTAAIVVLIAIIVKALILFLVLPLFADLRILYNIQLSSDLYDKIAWNIVSGNGYTADPDTGPTMLRSPGFVLMLAGLFSLFGNSLFVVQMMNFCFSTLTALVVFLIARELCTRASIAWLAAAVCFFFPGGLIADLRGGLESTQALLIAVTTLLTIKAYRIGSFGCYATLGLVFGFNILVKASVAFMVPALFLYEIIRTGLSSRSVSLIARYLVAGVVGIAVNAPWVIRNYQISGEFVPTMTVTGKSLYFGVYAAQHFTFETPLLTLLRQSADEENSIAAAMNFDFKDGYYPLFRRPIDEVRFYGHLGSIALAKVRDEPILLGKCLLFNTVSLWILGRAPTTTLINAIIAVPLLGLFLYGIFVAKHERVEYMKLLVPVAAYIAPFLFIAAQARYYIPIMPLLSVFVAFALVDIAARLIRGARHGSVSKAETIEANG